MTDPDTALPFPHDLSLDMTKSIVQDDARTYDREDKISDEYALKAIGVIIVVYGEAPVEDRARRTGHCHAKNEDVILREVKLALQELVVSKIVDDVQRVDGWHFASLLPKCTTWHEISRLKCSQPGSARPTKN